jgi:ABC-type lipoprotein release transport system permease subunit
LPEDDTRLTLHAVGAVTVDARGRFPAEADLATHDLVLLHPRDARTLLGLAPGAASDLALTVFHPEEAQALRPELVRAYPWPVQIVTREETRKHYAAAFGRRGGLASVLFLPGAVTLALLVAVVVRQQIGGRRRVGLLRALGWTSRDIIALQVAKSLLVGAPAVAVGLTAAYGLVYGLAPHWAGYFLLGWQQSSPVLPLASGFAGPVFLEVAGLLLAPYLAAVMWSSLHQAAADPQDLLRRGL